MQFDPYVPATWLNEELAVAVPTVSEQQKQQPEQRGGGIPRYVVRASVFAVGMAPTDVSFVSPSLAVAENIQVREPIGVSVGAAGDVPPGYWPKLVTLLRDAPLLHADDMSRDPAPLG